jgi:3-deoxy-D-manno-octulosonic-acid transferase
LSLILDILYVVGLLFALPFLLIKSARTGKYRSDWPARLGRVPAEARKPAGIRRLMLHCVSVGELLSVRLLVDRLLAADPQLQIVVTTTTDTGTARSREIYSAPAYANRVIPLRYPLDFSFGIRRFLDTVQPDAIVLVELETWPNFIRLAKSRHIPLAIINGRLTARSFKRYKLIAPVMRAMLSPIDWLGIQTQTIADRFIALGANKEHITILPTLKYDVADLSTNINGSDQLAAACGIRPEHQLFVGGSTGPGEETALLHAYRQLRTSHPNLRLAIAPRKPETVEGVTTAIIAAGLIPLLRTDYPDGTAAPADFFPDSVLVLNTLGELKKLYALGLGAFVGRSLVPLGGSDMIEVAAMAKPCCFGPHTHNFAEAVELLLGNNAAVMVPDAAALTLLLGHWLDHPEDAAALGQRAQETIQRQRGSTEIYVGKLLELIRPKTL